jgi:hypothetical protein
MNLNQTMLLQRSRVSSPLMAVLTVSHANRSELQTAATFRRAQMAGVKVVIPSQRVPETAEALATLTV